MILLCTASNDYIEKYQTCIKSQERYCQKNNYTYHLVDGSPESRNWKRFKIEELDRLLNETSEDVCLIDGDCYIKDSCPKMEHFINDSSIYYVNGHSGRLNSGFLYFKNDLNSKEFIKELKEKLKLPVPRGKGYYVTKAGENGHVIWLQTEWSTNNKNVFCEIGVKWNCTVPSSKNDAYILHFTGPLKKEIRNYANI